MARGPVAAAEVRHRRVVVGAPGDRDGATGVETAARSVDAIGLGISPASSAGRRRRDGSMTGMAPATLGCTGAAGRRTGLRRTGLDDAAQVHHGRAIADVRDHREVVGDEQDRDAEVRCSPDRRLRTWACTETSSAEVGSSATISRGSRASAAAMPTRWRWPPDSSCGRRSASDACRPTRSSRRATRSSRSSAAADGVRVERLAHGPRRRSNAGRARRTDPGTRAAPGAGRHAGLVPLAPDLDVVERRCDRPVGVEQAQDAAGERASCPIPIRRRPRAPRRAPPPDRRLPTAWSCAEPRNMPDCTGNRFTSPSTRRSGRSRRATPASVRRRWRSRARSVRRRRGRAAVRADPRRRPPGSRSTASTR